MIVVIDGCRIWQPSIRSDNKVSRNQDAVHYSCCGILNCLCLFGNRLVLCSGLELNLSEFAIATDIVISMKISELAFSRSACDFLSL